MLTPYSTKQDKTFGPSFTPYSCCRHKRERRSLRAWRERRRSCKGDCGLLRLVGVGLVLLCWSWCVCVRACLRAF